MSKASGSLFLSTAESIWSDASLAQGVIEESNVRPVVELTQLVKAMRSYQSAQKMVDAGAPQTAHGDRSPDPGKLE